jgi:hypothetical protein
MGWFRAVKTIKHRSTTTTKYKNDEDSEMVLKAVVLRTR